VSDTNAELDDARVTTGPVAESRSDHFEQLGHGLTIADPIKRPSASGERRLFSERDQSVGKPAQLLRLRVRRADRIVADQCRGEITHGRLAVRCRAVELASGVQVSQDSGAFLFLWNPPPLELLARREVL